MGYLKVSIDEARAIGSALKSNAEKARGDLSSLSSRVSPDAIWEGASASAYADAYDRWKQAETQLISASDDLGTMVTKIVDNFGDLDQQGGSAFSKF